MQLQKSVYIYLSVGGFSDVSWPLPRPMLVLLIMGIVADVVNFIDDLIYGEMYKWLDVVQSGQLKIQLLSVDFHVK